MKFKTNINCSGCMEKVSFFLDAGVGTALWKVDTSTPDKVLTVVGGATSAEIVAIVQQAGFSAQLMNDN